MSARKSSATTTTRATASTVSRTRRAPTPSAPTADDIAARAYFKFLERGSTHGRDQDDWLTAEQELSGRTVSAIGAR